MVAPITLQFILEIMTAFRTFYPALKYKNQVIQRSHYIIIDLFGMFLKLSKDMNMR